MADVNVPIRFEIYKGDQLVREEILAQDVIKIGKLASSHLRLDDETVSRMHAVIETTGPERDPRRRPRLDARDDGQRRADHQGAAAVGRRDHVRRLPRGRDLHGGAGAQETPPPGRAPGARRPRRRLRAAVRRSVRAAAAAGVRAAAAGVRAAARRRLRAAAAAGLGQRRSSRTRRRSFAGAPRRRRRGRGPRRLARDGGPDGLPRRRHRDAPPLQPRGEVDARPGDVDAVRRHRWPALIALVDLHLRRHRRRRARRSRYEAWQTAGKESKSFLWKYRSPVLPVDRLRRPHRRHRAVVHGPQAARQVEPELRHRLGRRRRRAGLGRLRAVARRTRWSPRPAPTTSSTSRRAWAARCTSTGRAIQLQQFIQQRGSSFSLPPGGSRPPRLRRDDLRRHARPPRPRALEVPFLTWKLERAGLHGRHRASRWCSSCS